MIAQNKEKINLSKLNTQPITNNNNHKINTFSKQNNNN